MTTLAQLQQEWKEAATIIYDAAEADNHVEIGLSAGMNQCAKELQPFIAQESARAAQREALEARIASLEAENKRMRDVLIVCRDAIDAQPIDAFGDGFVDHGPDYPPEPYPIRDELVYRISSAILSETQALQGHKGREG